MSMSYGRPQLVLPGQPGQALQVKSEVRRGLMAVCARPCEAGPGRQGFLLKWPPAAGIARFEVIITVVDVSGNRYSYQ